MTDKGTWAKPTNALEIADELLEPMEGFPAPTQLEHRAADALRRQHQIILTLEAAQAQAAGLRGVSDAQEQGSVPVSAHTTGESSGHPTIQAAVDRQFLLPKPDSHYINVTNDEQYLLNGTRFKLNFDGEGTVICFRNYFKELHGRWVALVAAEDDCHLNEQAEVEPVAWMHDSPGRFDVIHNEVKALWLRAGQPDSFFREKVPCKVEHYTIPLYTSPR